MDLTLHLHPLSSYCHKVLFGLYENSVPFTPKIVNFADAAERAAFERLTPIGKIPALVDGERVIPETTMILEYVDRKYPGAARLFPADSALCLEARLWDRILDLYLHNGMQKIVSDSRLDQKDPHGVAEAESMMRKTYAMLEGRLGAGPWLLGGTFSVADCAALPALFYGNTVVPHGSPALDAYFERLYARPGARRALDEAKPFFHWYPFHERIPARFR